MADPVVTSITAVDTWQKVATNVTAGQVHIMNPNVQLYYHTYRDTGESAPTDTAEGVVFVGNSMTIESSAGIDVYIYTTSAGSATTGSVRVDL